MGEEIYTWGNGVSCRRTIEILADDLVLYGDGKFYKDVVFCFGFAAAIDLLEAKRHATGNSLSDAAPDTVESWIGNARELAKLLDDVNARLICKGDMVLGETGAKFGTLECHA